MPSGKSLLKIVAVTDNQSAIDAIHSTSLVSDKWLHIELAALRQCSMHSEVNFQHIKGAYQLSDVLAKREASNKLLFKVLKNGALEQS